MFAIIWLAPWRFSLRMVRHAGTVHCCIHCVQTSELTRVGLCLNGTFRVGPELAPSWMHVGWGQLEPLHAVTNFQALCCF